MLPNIRRDLLSPLKRILAAERWAVVDTETTGLGADAEIVEIAVLDSEGVAFESLVRPRGPVHPEALRLHQLSADLLSDAPLFSDLTADLRRRLMGRTVLGYNVGFDRARLWNEMAQARQPAPRCRWFCLCELTTKHCGSRLSLSQALQHYGVDFEGPRHRAAGDARATLALARALAVWVG